MTAMTAATLDQLSDGRMLLGIGTSGPQVAEGWHGQRFAKPAPAHARVRRGGADGAGARARGLRRRDAAAAAARRAGQGAEADDRPRPGADPDLHRGDRAQEHDAGGRDRRRLAADAVLARARRRVPAAARGGLRARGRRQGLRRLRHRPDRDRDGLRRPRVRPRRDAPLRRAVRRRHGLAQAELLQRAGAPLRLRGSARTRSRSSTWRAARTRPPRRCRAS